MRRAAKVAAVLVGLGSPAAAADSAWVAACKPSATNAAGQICILGSTVMGAEANQMLFRIEMGKGSDPAEDFFRIIGPLGFYLPNGIGLVVDEVQVGRMPIERCTAQGCFTVLRDAEGLASIQAALQGGDELKIVFWVDPKQPQIVAVPIGDYAAAWGALEAQL